MKERCGQDAAAKCKPRMSSSDEEWSEPGDSAARNSLATPPLHAFEGSSNPKTEPDINQFIHVIDAISLIHLI
ncbi:hypothetical protein TWF694_009671 [Orbilia ellipsospora]|uniref:Uncharacterized protein n=1 Tax=Orbilia ellipsospora TaxID=2528407 RepID=A0AAV9XBJ8_9PEZI